MIALFASLFGLALIIVLFQGQNDTPWVGLLTGAIFGHATNTFLWPWLKARHCGKMIQLEVSPRTGPWIHLRVHNSSTFALKNAVVYVSIENELSDIRPTRPGGAFVIPTNPATIIEDRVAFALERNKSYEYTLTISPNERQSVLFVMYRDGNIGFASEQGHIREDSDGVILSASRCFLRPKDYCVLIKIVSDDAHASFWAVKVTPTAVRTPKRIRNQRQYEEILSKFKDPNQHNQVVCPCTP